MRAHNAAHEVRLPTWHHLESRREEQRVVWKQLLHIRATDGELLQFRDVSGEEADELGEERAGDGPGHGHCHACEVGHGVEGVYHAVGVASLHAGAGGVVGVVERGFGEGDGFDLAHGQGSQGPGQIVEGFEGFEDDGIGAEKNFTDFLVELLAAAPEGDYGVSEACFRERDGTRDSTRPRIELESDEAGRGNDVFKDLLADVFREMHERKGLSCDSEEEVERVVGVWKPEGRHVSGHFVGID